MLGRTNTGGGGGGLNFQVIGGATAPNNPKENTIWVNTSTTITDWVFSATQPTGATGRVWISTGTSSTVAFNAVKKNGIMVYPISAKQYVSDVWEDVTAQSYQNSVWTDWWDGYLYNAGDEYEDITGGWSEKALARDSSSGAKAPTVTRNEANIELAGTVSKGGIFYATNKINLSGYNTLTFNGELEPASTGSTYWTMVCVWSEFGSTYKDNLVAYYDSKGDSGEVTVDISALDGEYYVGLAIYGSSTITMNSMKVE